MTTAATGKVLVTRQPYKKISFKHALRGTARRGSICDMIRRLQVRTVNEFIKFAERVAGSHTWLPIPIPLICVNYFLILDFIHPCFATLRLHPYLCFNF